MGKRILKEQLIIAIILLLCGCSPIHFTENSHSQSVNTSSDRVVVSASDASTDNTLLEEETFSVKAQSAVEDFLSENQTPYRLGLFDLNEDGTPEVMVQNYIGQASKCIFYDLTDSEAAEKYIRLNWPTISVVNVYTQRSEDSVKWRIEGNDSHGFTDRTRNEILEIENGEMKTIDCELTYTLGDDIDVLFFEVDADSMVFERAHMIQAINCIAGESRNRFGYDVVDLTDFVMIMSIWCSSHIRIIRWNCSRLSAFIPEIPASANMSTSSHAGLFETSFVYAST